MNPPKRLRILSLLALAALILSACAAQAAPAASPTQAPTAVETEPPARGADEWRVIILDAFRGQDKQAWRYESVTVPEGGEESPTTIEYVPPDRYRIHSLPGRDIIVIGEQVFAQQEGQWTLTDIPAKTIVAPDSFSLLEKSISDVRCTSPEVVDGKTTHACAYKSSTRIGGSEETVQTQLWIDAETNLPYRMIIDGYIAQMDEGGNLTPVKAKSTLVYTFDPAIKIEAPQLPQ